MSRDSTSRIATIIEGAEDVGTSPETVQQAVTRLAAMEPSDYDRVRKAEAARLGIRVATLDAAVSKARGLSASSDQEVSDFLSDPEPWPDPVEGSRLLDDLTETVRAHLVLATSCAEAMALWAVSAHAHDCFDISPLLALISPTPACGKSTGLTLLGALVPRACPAANITAAALFRAVEKWRPTLLIDEADTFLPNRDELRGVLNSGHQRANAFVIRTTGDDHEPRQFRTWAPKVIAQIGKLPPTLASRAIQIEMRRKTAAETVKALRADRLDHLMQLSRRAARWAADNAVILRAADPALPAILSNRVADNWRPLIAIADTAGGAWPKLARGVAVSLGSSHDEQTAGIMLLSDLHDIFAERSAKRVSSAAMVEALIALEARPWPEWYQGKPITPRQIAGLLEPFGVAPVTIRNAGATAKGYRREDFEDAFARYLTPPSVTP